MILRSGCLQSVNLYGIPSLTAFPADGLPTSLQSLDIDGCKNLEFPPPETWCKYTSLFTLYIVGSCRSLTSFPLDGFPALLSLLIHSCGNLESIFISKSSFQLPSGLQSRSVSSCDRPRSLPQRMDTLTSLELLGLCNLPELELSFCEGSSLPPNLRRISITGVRLPTVAITKWGLQQLTALRYLEIGGDDFVNTLLKGRLLPISLVDLWIKELSNMKSLEGSGLQHLTSLESLTFQNCPRLESLPEDKLPSSLNLLHIYYCPLLEATYESRKGEHWSKISQIPFININNETII